MNPAAVLAPRLLLAAAMLLSADAVLFHSGWYARWLEPDSSAAHVNRLLRLELSAQKPGFRQIAAVGDSRMGFFVRHANERHAIAGYRFGTIALGGAGPRCWYYMLREIDPHADRYSAVILPLNDFDDQETDEVLASRLSDIHYLSGQLRLTDLAAFAGSYPDWPARWQAARAIVLRGFAYQSDLQAFLAKPRERLARLDLYQAWPQWVYGYLGETRSLAGVERAQMTDDMRGLADLLAHPPPSNGAMAAYRQEWLGRIVERYRESRTRLIFIRLPRSPFSAPQPANPNSSVREWARREPHVTLASEALFDPLEHREFFMDPLHLNKPGIERFSVMLADEVRRILEQQPQQQR